MDRQHIRHKQHFLQLRRAIVTGIAIYGRDLHKGRVCGGADGTTGCVLCLYRCGITFENKYHIIRLQHLVAGVPEGTCLSILAHSHLTVFIRLQRNQADSLLQINSCDLVNRDQYQAVAQLEVIYLLCSGEDIVILYIDRL